MKKIALLISCEHAVDTVPEQYLSLFSPFNALLTSHRGIDFGALAIAEHLKQQVPCDFFQATNTRLLVDCNRSMNHPACFSEVTRDLPAIEKKQILDIYYWPYRQQVIMAIEKHIKQGSQIWHLSIHSFTPMMNDIVRNADIGLLYDPQRTSERELSWQWKGQIKKMFPEYKIRMNYPYSGVSDGFTSALRKKFTNDEYVGIEVEINQAITKNGRDLETIKNILSISLLKLIC
jgi:predicted N-formylglutamate amidohydrolase